MKHPKWDLFFYIAIPLAIVLPRILQTQRSNPHYRDSKWLILLSKPDWIIPVLMTYVFGCLSLNATVDKTFFITALAMYFFFVNYMGVNVRETWERGTILEKVLLGCVMALVMVGCIQLFGTRQFGKIPKALGGGRPETAYVKFTPNSSNLPAALGLQASDHPLFTNGFYGPIAFLLRTEKEFIFISQKDLVAPDVLKTQIFDGYSTNLTLVTNSTPGVLTNVSITMVTNVAPLYKSVTYTNQAKTAKYIRADAIEAVVFGR